MRETPHRTHAEFAADLVEAMDEYLDRPFFFIGHCGAIPYMVETTLLLHERGLSLPERLFSSSWGAPHKGLYGRLNFVDLETCDVNAEIRETFREMGATVPDELVEASAEVLRHDLVVQRGYQYRSVRSLPVPVTVISWNGDTVVPPEEVHNGWEEIARTVPIHLDGRHLDFLSCPPTLRDLVAQQTGASVTS